MAITYLKKAEKTPLTGTDETQAIVRAMLERLEKEGEDAAMAYAKNLMGMKVMRLSLKNKSRPLLIKCRRN